MPLIERLEEPAARALWSSTHLRGVVRSRSKHVFAHKSTAGWEAQLDAMIDAGWVITASWPIDTERENRTRAGSSSAVAVKGQDDRFWSLAQHLSALYPASSGGKRLVDGVLARKKGLGF